MPPQRYPMRRPGKLGEYIQTQPYSVIQTKGAAGEEPLGPLSTPIIPAPGSQDTALDYLRQLVELTRAMPFMMMAELRKQLLIAARDAQFFAASTSAGPITIAASAEGIAATYVVNKKFAGALEGIGMLVIPASGAGDVTWSLRINGSVHPDFQGYVAYENSMATPYPFKMELTEGRTLQLIATNNGSVALTVVGRLIGYTEFLSEYKSYGSSPESGIG